MVHLFDSDPSERRDAEGREAKGGQARDEKPFLPNIRRMVAEMRYADVVLTLQLHR